MYELTNSGRTKADELDAINGPEDAVLAILADRNIPMAAEELAAALNSSEPKMEMVCRRLCSGGLAQEVGETRGASHSIGGSSFAPRHQIHYEEPKKSSTGEKVATGVGNVAVGLLKGVGKAFVGTVKYINKRGIEGIVIGNTEAVVGTRRGRELRKLERLRKDREAVLKGRRE